jgi:dTDP-4-dehydrorhamnose reductase
VKVLITGGTGQVGHALRQTAPKDIKLLLPTRKEFDLAKPEDIYDKLSLLAPDAIINAAAYTAVNKAEDEPLLAKQINAEAVGIMASYCNQQGIPLVHVSTDFVFSGHQSSPYKPADLPDPVCIYGKTKYAGEIAATTAYADTYIVRTSWVYSEHGGNFVKTMLRLAENNPSISVVDDQVGTPTYARDLAQVLWTILAVMPVDKVLHYSNDGQTSWYHFAVEIFSEAQRIGLLQAKPDVRPIPSIDYPTAAERAAYSVLDSSQTIAALGITQNDWQTSLHAMLARLSNND